MSADLDSFVSLGVPVPSPPDRLGHIGANVSGSRFYAAYASWLDRMDFDPAGAFTGRDGIWAYYPEGNAGGAPETDNAFDSTFGVDGDGRLMARNDAPLVDVPTVPVYYSVTEADMPDHGSPAYTPWSTIAGGTFTDVYPSALHSTISGRYGRWFSRAHSGRLFYVMPSLIYYDSTWYSQYGGLWEVSFGGITGPLTSFDGAVLVTSNLVTASNGDAVWHQRDNYRADTGERYDEAHYFTPTSSPTLIHRHYLCFWDGVTVTKMELFDNNSGSLEVGIVPAVNGGVWFITNDNTAGGVVDESGPGAFTAYRYTKTDGIVDLNTSPWMPADAAQNDFASRRMVYARGWGLTNYDLLYSAFTPPPQTPSIYLGRIYFGES